MEQVKTTPITPAAPTGRIKSDKVQRTGMALPEAGRIKIGEKAKNVRGVEYPTSLDYFRPTGTFAEHFTKVFGPKPDKITVVFISDNITDSCNEEFACWENGKRWGWGDGETFNVWDSKAANGKGEYVTVMKGDPLLAGKKWDVMLTMRFLIPELKGVLGHWVFTTKGAKTTIPSMVKAFDFIKERMGTVIGVPFELVVEKSKGYTPGEARQYSRVKLIPCISEQYMEKVRDFLAAGKSITELAPLMVTEAKLLGASDSPESRLATIEAHVETVDATHEEVAPADDELTKLYGSETPPDLFAGEGRDGQ